MRTTIEIPDDQIETLHRLSAQLQVSRAELLRRAVADYLAQHAATPADAAFGLWRRRGEDGLDYQARLRQEWEE